jgi:hypothetical protein
MIKHCKTTFKKLWAWLTRERPVVETISVDDTNFINKMIDNERMHFATIAGISGAGFAFEASRQHMERKIAELETMRGIPGATSAYIDKCNKRDAEWQAIWRAPQEQKSALRDEYERKWG